MALSPSPSHINSKGDIKEPTILLGSGVVVRSNLSSCHGFGGPGDIMKMD